MILCFQEVNGVIIESPVLPHPHLHHHYHRHHPTFHHHTAKRKIQRKITTYTLTCGILEI